MILVSGFSFWLFCIGRKLQSTMPHHDRGSFKNIFAIVIAKASKFFLALQVFLG